jgi:maleylpyruvate isomerase
MYAGRAERDADIEAGAGRSAAEQVADLTAAAARFAAAARALPADRFDVVVRAGSGRPLRAGDVPWGRLRELEIHHVDLGLDYPPARWEAGFVSRLLPEVVTSYDGRADAPAVALRAVDTGRAWAFGTAPHVEVAGDERALLAWLLGRSSGEGLRAAGGSLPALPPWA